MNKNSNDLIEDISMFHHFCLRTNYEKIERMIIQLGTSPKKKEILTSKDASGSSLLHKAAFKG